LGISLNQINNLEPNSLYEEKVAIETIKVGDYVLSWNESNGKREYKKVLNTFIRDTSLIYTLKIGSDKLETTWNHPFWVQGKGFVKAKDLVLGEKLVSSQGKILSLNDITIEERDKTVYNFEVEDNHTYYVGQEEVLVHNDRAYTQDDNKKSLVDLLVEGERYITLKNGQVIDIGHTNALIDVTDKSVDKIEKILEDYNKTGKSKQDLTIESRINIMGINSMDTEMEIDFEKRGIQKGAKMDDPKVQALIRDIMLTHNYATEYLEGGVPKGHGSSMRNEDLKSNYIGTEIALNAKSLRAYNPGMDREISFIEARKRVFDKLQPAKLIKSYDDNTRSINYKYSVSGSESLYEHQPMVNEHGNGLAGIKSSGAKFMILRFIKWPRLMENLKRNYEDSKNPPVWE
jgi:hypothetical protein